MRIAISGRREQRPDQPPFENRIYVASQFAKISDELGFTLIPAVCAERTAASLAEVCDGLILSGTSNDIDPSYYGEEPLPGISYAVDEYAGDRALIEAFAAAEKPILGICGGLQSLNVFFGGSLHQHVEGHYLAGSRKAAGGDGCCDGGGREAKDEGRRTHEAEIVPGTFLAAVYGPAPAQDSAGGAAAEAPLKIEINSFHHQAVKDLAPGFTAAAFSGDGLVEAIEKGNLIGVQWHPEAMMDMKFFRAFVARFVSA